VPQFEGETRREKRGEIGLSQLPSSREAGNRSRSIGCPTTPLGVLAGSLAWLRQVWVWAFRPCLPLEQAPQPLQTSSSLLGYPVSRHRRQLSLSALCPLSFLRRQITLALPPEHPLSKRLVLSLILTMEQKTDTPQGLDQDPPVPAADRPVPQRTDSSLPPHYRPSVIEVPVTPGISRDTYEPEESGSLGEGSGNTSPGYFSRKDIDHALAPSPEPIHPSEGEEAFKASVVAGADESKEFLRRLSLAVMGSRRESISEIRKTSPSLALSGNIISVTFNIPHTFKYRKGSDWVSERPVFEFSTVLGLSRTGNRGREEALGRLERRQVSGWWG